MRASAAFMAHCAEEYPRFPDWATRHFGTTTPQFYVASHAVLIPLVVAVDRHASRGRPTPFKAWTATAMATTLAANAGFHAGATVAFREYSPGVVTGLGLLVPVAIADIRSPRHRKALRRRDRAIAITAGIALNAAIVASLWVDMPRLDGRSPAGSARRQPHARRCPLS